MRIAAMMLLAAAAAAHAQQPPVQTVEQTRKNIKVLQGLPEHQLFMAMNSVAQSLGVHCDHCHVRNGETWVWESDAKPPKLVARDMIRMTRAIRPAVSCYSCHRGSLKVERIPPLPPHDPATDPPRAAHALPPAAEIIRRYIAAVGGSGFNAIGVEVDIESAQGRRSHAAVDIAKETLAFTIDTPEGTVRHRVEGTAGWTDTGGGPKPMTPEVVVEARRKAGIYEVMKVEERPEELQVLGIERIRDRDAYAVAAGNKTYYFDVTTGLLLRERLVIETLLSPLPEQVDYDDYRAVEGAKLPFLIETSDAAPFDTGTRRITKVRLDGKAAASRRTPD